MILIGRLGAKSMRIYKQSPAKSANYSSSLESDLI